MPAVLFVCLGNICRSPAAECLLQHLAKERGVEEDFVIASCGTGRWNMGASPDARMREAAAARNYVVSGTSQPLDQGDYYIYDLLLAADHSIKEVLLERAPSPEFQDKIAMMTLFSQRYPNYEIPDPYMGGQEGFSSTIDILEDACHGLLRHYCPS